MSTQLKKKTKEEYWQQFSSYQSFQTTEEMIAQVKLFESTYELTPAVKAVLNTIKLHAKKTFVGVCWLYREEIAKKAKVSLGSVKRAIKLLRESGILSVYTHIHTKKGGQSHNVYVINPIFETGICPANEPPAEGSPEPSETVVARDSADHAQTHKNSHTNSHKQTLKISIDKFDILKNVPNEFIDLMEPFYANSPEIIRNRWRTVLSAAKNSCNGVKQASFDTIGQAWTDVVKFYKRGKIKNSTEDGIGAYFYGVLCDYLLNDWLRNTLRN